MPDVTSSLLRMDRSLERLERTMIALSGSGPIIREAVTYHLQSGGRRVRAKLALEACAALGVEADTAVLIAAGCELLHNASLIHDDCQDQDHERRGRAAVWRTYGVNIAICAGDQLISSAYAALASAPNSGSALVRAAHECVAQVIEGQAHDLVARGDATVNQEDYRTIATAKSAPLLSLPLRLALIQAGRQDACELAEAAVAHFALGYQILDDIQDVEQDRAAGDSLNLVLILERTAQESSSARDAAAQRAMFELDRSINLASELPNGTGALLQSYARDMAAQLTFNTKHAGSLAPA